MRAVKREDIINAYLFLRENNHDIPSESLEFIKAAALQAYDVSADEGLAQIRHFKDGLIESFDMNKFCVREKCTRIANGDGVIKFKADYISALWLILPNGSHHKLVDIAHRSSHKDVDDKTLFNQIQFSFPEEEV